jgi:hypothetical protein
MLTRRCSLFDWYKGKIRQNISEARVLGRGAGTRRVDQLVVPDHAWAERRKERREMHLDRRKSGVDLLEHVMEGMHCERVRATAHERQPRTTRRRNR